MIQVILPSQLRRLAGIRGRIELDVPAPVTQRAVIDAIEARYPVLRGTIRDYATGRRRPLLRFHACELDLSEEPPDAVLPEEVAAGDEPFIVIASIAGG
jgi:hypothetical protein